MKSPLDRSWITRAACLGCDPALFVSEGRGNHDFKAAKAVCATCPVRRPCLKYSFALAEALCTEPEMNSLMKGVWGGYTEQEREIMRSPFKRAKRGPVKRVC